MQDGKLSFTNQGTVQQQPQQPHNVLREVQQQGLARQRHQMYTPNSTSVPLMPDCHTFSQGDLHMLANQDNNESHQSAWIEAQLNLNFNLMQQHQQLLRSQTLPGNNAQMAAWDIYPQNMLATQANVAPQDMRCLSAQSDTVPNSQRPLTPAHENNNTRKRDRTRDLPSSKLWLIQELDYLPITPATTPFKKSMGVVPYNTEVQSSPTKEQSLSVPEAVKASYMQRARSLQGVTEANSSQTFDLPSPPNTATFEVDSFDTFNGQQQDSRSEKSESQSSSRGNHVPSLSASSSFYSSPEIAPMPSSPAGENERPRKVPIYPATPSHKRMSSTATTASSTPSKPKLSPRVASIDNLNLDERVHASINQTGVTIDEIASYISGPDPEDGKWVCLHPGCERRFGRKENIKSHVQTHLGDRQFKCDHCNKCFVRGHDLKRHAKIHTGDKPYECLCGNVFARHDALTRHRQRGMCIGGYKGIVRKNTKRGRPKKHRPEMEERQDKASRTRVRVAEKTSSSSSVSGSSDFSRSTPSSEVFENMSLRGSSPINNGPMFHTPNYSALPPEAFTFTPPASPGCSTGNKPSPHCHPRSLTPCTEDEMLPSKQPMQNIDKGPSLPFIAEAESCPYPDVSNSSNDNNLSSPHTAPTLADSTHESDLDIFINQDATTNGFDSNFPPLTDSSIAAFPDYVNTAPLDGPDMDIFRGKTLTTGPSMDDEFFSFQFQVNAQPSEYFMA